nr:MAG TPA: cytochrome oxidase subunit [Caudoviricetes sp.]
MLKDSYIFYKGHDALYGDERFYNLFNFKMVSSPNFLLRWFDSSRRLNDYNKN